MAQWLRAVICSYSIYDKLPGKAPRKAEDDNPHTCVSTIHVEDTDGFLGS